MSELLLSQEQFKAVHEGFFGDGSCGPDEIDDGDICFVVAKAQLRHCEPLIRKSEQERIARSIEQWDLDCSIPSGDNTFRDMMRTWIFESLKED